MIQTATKTDCPAADVLAKYVSGSLVEAHADRLLSHVESCAKCQHTIDEMARRADSLVSAMRRTVAAPSAQDSQQLDRLIATVQQTRAATPISAEGKIDPVPLDQFLSCLSKSGLADAGQISTWLRDFSPDSSLSFANTLVDRGALTPLQARALLRGRWRGLVLGSYVVLEKLGQGGMGQVYRARRRDGQADVCVKVLHPKGQRTPDHVERFRREAKAVAALDHPNIVVAYDADEADGIHYLAMELVEGADLAKSVAANGPLPADVAIRYVLQAATALAYAHSRGVIHRDIKPHNLFLEDSGCIKILDLGLARIDSVLQPESESAFSTMTKTGMVVGTVDYIAPEQAINAKHADYRSDIYSLGCTLHYLLTGRPVYPGETLMARLVAHREEPIPSLLSSRGDVSPRLDAVFQKMVAKHPNDRYQSMTELARELQAMQRSEQPAAVAQPPIQIPIPLEPVDEPVEQETLDGFDAPTLNDTASLNHPASFDDAPTLDLAAPTTLKSLSLPSRSTSGFSIPKPVLLWSSIGAGVLAVGVLMFIAASLVIPGLSASAGASNETEGGLFSSWVAGREGSQNGSRAVVVVAPYKFKSADYHAVTAALSKQNIPFVIASTKGGEAKGDDGTTVQVSLALADYKPRSTDLVILCGGHDLHGVKESNIADRALQQGAVLFPVGNGFDVVYPQYQQARKHRGKDWDEMFSGGEAIRAGNGVITKACTLNDVPTVVSRAFTEFALK